VAQRETPAASVGAGVLIALGIAMKVTPVIFVGYFIWRRRWLVAAAALAGIVLWSLVPAIAFGWDQNIRWLGQWSRIMLLPYLAQGKVAYATSQSAGSFALRLLTETPAFDTHRAGIAESHYMNVLSLSPTIVDQIVRAMMVATVTAGLWWTRNPLRTLRARRYVVEVGAVAAFMLWFSERTWIPHYVSFVLPLAAAGMIVSDPGVREERRHSVRQSLIVFAAATLLASEIGRVFGRDGVDWAKAAGVYLWPSVLLTFVTLRAATRSGRVEAVDDLV
jgi:hypothetical protein